MDCKMNPRVAVVGAGVIGLSAALHLLERFPGALDLTVMAAAFSPNITSNKAAAIILPPNSQSQSKKQASRNPRVTQQIIDWYRSTMQRLHSIYSSKENADAHICLEQGYIVLESQYPDPWYKEEVFGFRHVALDSVEARLLHLPPQCVDVWSFSTYILETTPYLSWLMGRTSKEGGTFQERTIASFDELSSYDIIINCTGLGSRDLLDDKLIRPARGQMVVVKAPWIKHWVHNILSSFYIFPRAGNVVLGGTTQLDNWDESPDPETSETILEKCQEDVPSLCGAEVMGEWAGLRPSRESVRLESCPGPENSLLVHCYGHGGQGFILSWGCALDIGNIVHKRLMEGGAEKI